MFKSASPSFQAKYILGRIESTNPRDILSRALQYPLCSEVTLSTIARNLEHPLSLSPDLPRRLFRNLTPERNYGETDDPLPFLHYLWSRTDVGPPNVNTNQGYALTKAVHAKFVHLVRFLLDHGASPQQKNCLPVMVAIRQKSLPMVKMLIERTASGKSGMKKRRLEDRVPVNPEMLKLAVKCKARDIVIYLTQEKHCSPDMQTLSLLMLE